MGLFAGVSKEQIIELLNKLKSENAKVCEDYKKEPEKVIGFIVGFVMRNTGGKANSNEVKELIKEIF